jgi:ribonuclease BN (tRNA processing enzyme)
VRPEFKDIGKAVTYSCDGEPSEGLEKLAIDSDILIRKQPAPEKPLFS